MTMKVSWAMNLQVSGGTSLAESATIDVEGIGEVSAKIEPTTVEDAHSGELVEVQPSGTEKIAFFLLTADTYSDKLKYKIVTGVNDTEDGSANTYTEERMLDGPHFLIGPGAVALLGGDPVTFLFVNEVTEGEGADAVGVDVHIHILVGRAVNPT